MRLKVDLSGIHRLVFDLNKLSGNVAFETNVAMMSIGQQVQRQIINDYTTKVYGNRRKPPIDTGMWGSMLKLVTRGTGSTPGRSFVLIQASASYAGDLENGAPVTPNDRGQLVSWAVSKLDLEPVAANNVATRIIQRGRTMPTPIMGLFDVNEISGYADAHMRAALARALARSRS